MTDGGRKVAVSGPGLAQTIRAAASSATGERACTELRTAGPEGAATVYTCLLRTVFDREGQERGARMKTVKRLAIPVVLALVAGAVYVQQTGAKETLTTADYVEIQNLYAKYNHYVDTGK